MKRKKSGKLTPMPTKMLKTKPILRWVGGKTKLLPEIITRITTFSGTYYEPFVGGATVLLACKFPLSVVSDQNRELINFYEQVRTNWRDVLSFVQSLPCDKETYMKVRAWDRDPGFLDRPAFERAARFWFLNKLSFQGLWRVNRKGFYNVPYGSPNTADKFVEQDIRSLSDVIQNVRFLCCDFEAAIVDIKPDDFVYFDPPYLNTYNLYTGATFSMDDHTRLRDACVRLDKMNVRFLLSNSDCEEVRRLYSMFKIDTVTVKRLVSAKSSSRGDTTEVLVWNK